MFYKKFDTFLFYFVLLLAIMALSFSYNGLDNDLFSRLIQGKAVVECLFPMTKDIFSYTPTDSWVDHEWLFSGLFYLIQKTFGLFGLVFLKGALIFLYVFSISFAISKMLKIENSKENPYNFSFYFLLVLHIVNFNLIYNTIKIQWISFILLPFWILCLEKLKFGNKKYLFILSILSVFWLNCHGGILAGVGILFLYVLNSFILKKPSKCLCLGFVLVLLTFFINPWGYKYILFLFDALTYDKSSMSEWSNIFNPQIRSLNLWVYKFFLLFSAFWIILQFKKFKNHKETKPDFARILVLLATMVLSILHIKHIELFIVCFSLYCYQDFYKLFNFTKTFILKALKNNFFYSIQKYFKYLLYIFVLIYSFVLISNSSYKETTWADSREFFPVDCVNFLIQNNVEAKVLAPFTVSDYVSFKGYPRLKVFMNSRYEQVYPKEYLKMTTDFFNLEGEKPLRILFEYPPDIIIFENYRPIARNSNILIELGYSQIYQDNFYSAFVINSKRQFSYFYPRKLTIKELDHIFETNFNKQDCVKNCKNN